MILFGDLEGSLGQKGKEKRSPQETRGGECWETCSEKNIKRSGQEDLAQRLEPQG